MAKTRSRAKKRAAAARPAAGKARKKTAKKKAGSRTPKAAQGLDLKKLRKDLELAVGVLSNKASRFKDPPPQLLQAQNLMGRWASEIDDICSAEEQETCGPTMFIPLPPP